MIGSWFRLRAASTNLREFFEVNRHHIVITALKALADDGKIANNKVSEAIKKYAVDAEKAVPWVA